MKIPVLPNFEKLFRPFFKKIKKQIRTYDFYNKNRADKLKNLNPLKLHLGCGYNSVVCAKVNILNFVDWKHVTNPNLL